MKNLKFIFSVLLMFMATSLVNAQSWTTYNADEDPLLEFVPAFEESNVGGVYERTQIPDPDDASNSLLRIVTDQDTDGSNDNYQLRQQIGTTTPTAITVVFRAKGNDPAKFFLFDMDMDFNAFRSQIRIHSDGTVDVANGTPDVAPDPLTINTQEWNIYRYTRDGDQFALYVNEDLTPVVTGTAAAASTNNFFRFGDGWGSSGTRGISTDFDWLTWDLTGAYSPADQALPPELVAPVANWVIYNADEDPLLEFVPAFEESNTGGVYERTQVPDPNNASNNLLRIITDQDTDGSSDNYQLRQRLADPQPTAITVVFRAKGNDPSKVLLFDMDMDFNTFRSQVRILTDGTLDVANGTADVLPDPLTINTQEWNTYRFTRNGDQFALYVNEDPTPVVTGTGDGGRTNNYYRFGDGWGNSGTSGVSTDFDWVTWDYSGAYSPSDKELPDELTRVPVGDWTTYQADLDPVLEFVPAFEESNTGGVYERTQITDPDDATNNLLRIITDQDTDGSSDNYQLRQRLADPQPTAITVVFRAKGNDPSKVLLFDMDMDFNTFRSQVRILTDGTLDVANGTEDAAPDPLTINTQDWNIYRFTRDGDQFALYVNEDPTPVVTGTSEGGRTNNYYRFGDGWGNSGTSGVSTDFDWVTWDYSGAYSPSQSRLPDELALPPLGDWTVYQADLDPVLEFVPAFEESNTGGVYERTQIADPDDATNNLLRIITDQDTDASSDNYQLRQRLADPQPTAITVVFRAKGNDPSKVLLFDMDMDFNTFRSQIRILTDGTLDVANGTPDAVPDPLTVNTQDWNIYRFTRDGDQFALYLNEDPTPVVTGTSDGGRTNNYYRFGDGWGNSGTSGVSTDFDWVTWDYSGAYSPNARRLPDELTGTAPEVPVATVKTIGSVAALSQDLGLATDFTIGTYKLSGTDLTDNITVTPPVNFEVSVDTTNWFTNANPLVIAHTDGIVEDTVIIVRLNATVVGDYSGDISNTSPGADEELVSVSGTTIDLIPEITITGTLVEFIQNISTPSSSQNYRVSGVNLKDSVTVTAPDGYEVSADNIDWGTSFRIGATERTITNSLVYVRQFASTLGSVTGSISHTSPDATEATLAAIGEVISDPGITVEGDFTDFSQSLGTPSVAQSYTISGSSLTSNIDISLPDGYQISIDENLWLNSLTLVPLDGIVETMTLFVRLNAIEKGTHSGNIIHSSVGVDDVGIAVSGTTDDVILSVGIGQNDIVFALWPNPSSDKITIQRENELGEAKISVYSLQGNLISQFAVGLGAKLLELDIRGLESGVYIVGYEGDGKVITQRLIKN